VTDRDPFRPQDPWKAEWHHRTEHYRGGTTSRDMGRLLLFVWLPALALLGLLSLVLSTQALGIVGAIVVLGLLLTVRV
jgi:hypothetical protein